MANEVQNSQLQDLKKELIGEYDFYLVMFSGGKDSLACFLHLLDCGVDKNKIELWHHRIDGGGEEVFMDWAVTDAYCEAVAYAFDVPIYYSWREGGFYKELMKKDEKSKPVLFETPDGLSEAGGKKGKIGTRRQFPQVSADLRVRWCSASLKIDVGSVAINNQKRFHGKRIMVITGERAEESKNRSRYSEFEPHRCHSGKKHVDAWRPILRWEEKKVWEIIERYRVNPHPAYKLGWGRVSCATCIFGSDDQWASMYVVNRSQTKFVAKLEKSFGKTIHRTRPVFERVRRGTPYETITKEMSRIANSKTYDEEIIVENWELPSGAFGESCGPT